MRIDIRNKKHMTIIILIGVMLIGSFFVFNKVGKADSYADQIAIRNVSLTGIDTGNGSFTDDGLNYGDANSYSASVGYITGNDSNKNNRLIRSFDTLTYHFNFRIKGKTVANDYEERKVNIKVTIPDNLAKYITFDPNTNGGETSKTFTFSGIDTYGEFNKDISMYVLGAPNGTQIKPRFEIQESTNTDPNEVVTLGNYSGDSYYYDYDSELNRKYTSTSNTMGFNNYLPSIVSARTGLFRTVLLAQNTEGQKTTYNGEVGRYLTYVFGLAIVGNSTSGIKGLTMPNGDAIKFNLSASQNGNNPVVTIADGWTRVYGSTNVGEVEPIVVSLPYSSQEIESSRRVKIPGDITLAEGNATINNYGVVYNPVKIAADNTNIATANHYFGTYAVTVFSPRAIEDAKNDINVTASIGAFNITDTGGAVVSVPAVSASQVNKYYEVIDYSLTGEFYDAGGATKISNGDNGSGSVSKGTNLKFKTTFNYKKTMSSQGLKEVIKFDTNAYRVVPYDDKKDIKITVISDSGKLSSDDFEIKFVSGKWNNDNYVVANNSEDELDPRISPEDRGTITSACSSINVANLTVDQTQNLYGGPCIKAKEEVETIYEKLEDAKTKTETGNIEDPISKVIVQTKEGVILPDNTKVVIEVPIRVRNVSDLTQAYQATALATSSDYDENLTYYAPRVTPANMENSVTNPNNYRKTTYIATTISSIDTDSVWGDTLKIVNFTSREKISVLNKNADGTMRINYNVVENETLNYNVKTTIVDDNENSGADDVWYINHLKVRVVLPNTLTYVPNKSLGTPEVSNNNDGTTTLIYTLPYTKPNQKVPDINFKAILKPNISGTGVPVTVTSTVEAININGETDRSYFGYLTDSFTVYATGIQNVIVNQKVGAQGTVVEKNSEFSYLLSGYNNTGNDVNDYNIIDVLPYSGDKNGTKYSGSYKVKVTIPSSLNTAKIYCSTQEPQKLTSEVFNKNNVFKECNVTDEYVEATAIKITDIPIRKDSYMDDILVSVKPTGNNYSDNYTNLFVGGSRTFSETKSNKIKVRVISRNISGRVFVDNDEDGMEEEGDKYLSGIPIALYKYDSENKLSKITDTMTNNNGEYKFKDLDVGRYLIKANYDSSLYDLTIRYGTEDKEHDSDAYKVADGEVEIAYMRNIDDIDAQRDSLEDLKVTREIETVTDMNIGLISKTGFGFDMSKYITKIDLNYNNTLNTLNYDNQQKVSISVKNSLKATAKVYYGMTITNSSTKPGYAKLIQEDIPNGMTFDPNDPYNSQWFVTSGGVQTITYAKDLINPGESRYLKIVLDMPRQEQAATFVNTVAMLEIEQYKPDFGEDKNADSNTYEVGEGLAYAGVNWHVVSAEPVDDTDEQILTLLADAGTISSKYAHIAAGTAYKWSDSRINNYINNGWISTNTLNTPILYDNVICNDASGTPNVSYGGTLQSENVCNSLDYRISKVRLLTETEFNKLKNSHLTDMSWFNGSTAYWLQNSAWIEQTHDLYGRIKDATNYKSKAKFVSSGVVSIGNANEAKEVRPVITVSNKNIIPE